MADIIHIETKQVGGDINWWTYGGLFVHRFKHNGAEYRELWKTFGQRYGFVRLCQRTVFLDNLRRLYRTES